MSKAKPFLFGSALGASAMFVALQYHIVHTHDGFQILPRAPQQSVGLAYADIRNWSASEWTDRPELARALMAHGSGDLISESVANSLADRVTEDNSTLEELRGFLNRTELKRRPDLEEDESSGSDPETADRPGRESSENEIFSIPFPQDARNSPGPQNKPAEPEDPFRTRTANVDAELPPAGGRFSAAEVLADQQRDTLQPPAPVTRTQPGGIRPTAPAGSKSSTADEAQRMEDRIFGTAPAARQHSGAVNPTTSKAPAAGGSNASPVQTDSAEAMFEEVPTTLENRAQEALNRARQAAAQKPPAGANAQPGNKPAENFIRSRVEQVLSKVTSGIAPADSTTQPQGPAAESPSSETEFNPFLE